MTKPPTPSTVKRLFALSCNTCSYEGCEQKLADPSWPSVMADIAHIRGERRGAARHDADMDDDDLRDFFNLILLCPVHHRLVDDLEPDAHPVSRLTQMKEKHERQCHDAQKWANDEMLDHYADLALTAYRDRQSSPPSIATSPRPRLVVQQGNGEAIEIENVGDATALSPTVIPVNRETEDAYIGAAIAPPSLPEGGVWKAGHYAPSLGDSGLHALRLLYKGPDGEQYSDEFPL